MMTWRGFQMLVKSSLLAAGGLATAALIAQEDVLGEELLPPRPPVEIPNPWLPWLWAAGVLLALGLLVMLWRFWSRRAEAAKPQPTPYEVALARLEEADAHRQPETAERYVVAVTEALRHFIEEAFALPAPEQTTEEFLLTAREHPFFAGAMGDRLGAFLRSCDLVKFARQSLGPGELSQMREEAAEFLRTGHESWLQAQAEAKEKEAKG